MFRRSLLSLALLTAPAVGAGERWLGWFGADLANLNREQADTARALAALGTPVVGQTVPEFGYQHPRLSAPPPASPWVQVDLQTPQPIDWVALIPAQVDWQPVGSSAYGFPLRFRIDASDDPTFAAFTPVAVFTDSDFPDPGIGPVPLRAGGIVARYVRVTATKLAVENAQYFFALAEIMVLSGQRNIAIDRPVGATAAINLRPRWSPANLVDGRTPLGPPVQRELLPYDGLYTGDGGAGSLASLWMSLDLGRVYPLQELRIHPVHARLGADIPGFAFPSRFLVEAADDPAFAAPAILLDASAADFPNPGNNPLTVRTPGVGARYLRFAMVAPSLALQRHRFGLSEIEVFSAETNVARTAAVSAPPDPFPMSRDWPLAQLNDGFTSYGRLVALPDWLASWQQRRDLVARQQVLARSIASLEGVARGRALAAGLTATGLAAAAVGLLLVRQQRRRTRELEAFRTRLAHDLHDEIGSNLAGLAVMGESLAAHSAAGSAAGEDWREVHRVATETTAAMREVLWVIGAREEAGLDLAAQLRQAATRMLAGRTVVWLVLETPAPAAWPADAPRQAFLFFKEALANIVRHSGATAVTLSATIRDRVFTLTIADNGIGFDPAHAHRGLGLASLRERARLLGGRSEFASAPGGGATVALRVPVKTS